MSSNREETTNEVGRLLPAFMIAIILIVLAMRAQGQTVHQLFYNNSIWTDQNLFGATTDSQSGVAAFPTTPNNLAHVYYLSSSDHVRQLFFNGTSLSDEDLSSETGGPTAKAHAAVVGFALQNFQYVFYPASNGHIHQLLYNNAIWADTDLTATTGGPTSDGAQLTAFATGTALHVYYVSTGKHVQQLYNVGGGWANQDLTSMGHGPTTGGLWMSGFSIANFQYVYYVGSDRNIHELVYNNSTWSDENISPLIQTPAGGCGIAAMVIPGTKKMRVYFVGTGNHIFQLAAANNKKWTSADLTKKTKGPAAVVGNQIVAFA